ncbi:MAG: type II toxin-antitoxin system VapC family toxin [Egibacteraceae bacterium]
MTLAEVLRGGHRDASIHRILSRVVQLPVSPALGRRAGELLGSTGLTQATVDAVVAATALDQPGPVVVLTSDPADLAALTGSRADVVVQRV